MRKEIHAEKLNKDFNMAKNNSDFDHDKIIRELDLSNNFATGYMILYR